MVNKLLFETCQSETENSLITSTVASSNFLPHKNLAYPLPNMHDVQTKSKISTLNEYGVYDCKTQAEPDHVHTHFQDSLYVLVNLSSQVVWKSKLEWETYCSLNVTEGASEVGILPQPPSDGNAPSKKTKTTKE